MENDNVGANEVAKLDEGILVKAETTATHTLGLQDLYKAAFSQEAVGNFSSFDEKSTIISTNLIQEPENKFYGGEGEKIDESLAKQENIYKSPNFDEPYQLYTLKGLQYSVDLIKQEDTTLELSQLNYVQPKGEAQEELTTATVLSRPYETLPADANSVLDLDKGIQIHLIKPDGLAATTTAPSLTYAYENCEYTGDAQILHRYLSDSALFKSDGSQTAPTTTTVTLNFVNKQNNNLPDKSFFDSDSVGVNPETLGVRFEDCDFNSSDSFASTESIIPKNIQCPKCPKKFMFKSDLIRHDKYKHSVKPKLFCKYCNKEFVTQQNLLFHEKSHKKKRNSFKCQTCKKVFKKFALLIKHMMNKHPKAEPISCAQCEKVFSSQGLWSAHVRKCHWSEGDKPYKCDICARSFEKKQGLSCHAKAHLEGLSHVCQLCNRAFSKASYLKNHQKWHLSEDKDCFVCDTCGKDFNTANALEEHSRKHTGEKPFTCSVCMKSFAYKAYFKVHIKKHAEVKQFSCGICQKSFVTSEDLSKHEETHTKEKSYYHCINCNQYFNGNNNFVAHLKDQKCGGNKSQEVCTQTTEFPEATNLPPNTVALQNVNVIVDQSFSGQQPIVLTSLGGFINSNSVPVILTQNPSVPYSVSSIT